MKEDVIPLLVGYTSEQAEACAKALGLSIIWIESEIPRWLSQQRETRVGRQRLLENNSLELLRVWSPTINVHDK